MDEFPAGLIVGLIVGAALSGVAVDGFATSHHRSKAISAGVAKYEVNDQTGDTKFVYLSPATPVMPRPKEGK